MFQPALSIRLGALRRKRLRVRTRRLVLPCPGRRPGRWRHRLPSPLRPFREKGGRAANPKSRFWGRCPQTPALAVWQKGKANRLSLRARVLRSTPSRGFRGISSLPRSARSVRYSTFPLTAFPLHPGRRRCRIPAFLKWPGVGAEGAAPPTREPHGHGNPAQRCRAYNQRRANEGAGASAPASSLAAKPLVARHSPCQGERGIPEPRSGEDMPRKPLDMGVSGAV